MSQSSPGGADVLYNIARSLLPRRVSLGVLFDDGTEFP
jgi:hypothetical protein